MRKNNNRSPVHSPQNLRVILTIVGDGFALRWWARVASMACLCGLALSWAVVAQERRQIGPLQRQLDLPVQVTWENVPLKISMLRLAEIQGLSIFLDRRVDPSRLVNVSVESPTLRQGMPALAEQLGLQVSLIGDVIYLGPAPSTAKLATLLDINRERMKKVSPGRRRAWRKPVDSEWPRLAEPAGLASSWSDEAGVPIRDLDRIPHDLWDAGELPAMGLLERLTILLAGFDLTVRIESDGTATIVKIPATVSVERSYSLTAAQAERLDEIRERLGKAEFKIRGRRMNVVATSEQHAAIREWMRGGTEPNSPVTQGEQRYTLSVENQPVAGVLRSLCQRMRLQLDLSRLSQDQAAKLISLDVKNVNRDGLLRETVSQAGLRYRMEGRKLVILPPPS